LLRRRLSHGGVKPLFEREAYRVRGA
jgi:hypothetical protein